MEDDVIEYYRGFPIKKYNRIYLRVSQFEIKRFIDAKLDIGLSARDLLESSGTPCNYCKNIDVIVYNKSNDSFKIKRGILKSKR